MRCFRITAPFPALVFLLVASASALRAQVSAGYDPRQARLAPVDAPVTPALCDVGVDCPDPLPPPPPRERCRPPGPNHKCDYPPFNRVFSKGTHNSYFMLHDHEIWSNGAEMNLMDQLLHEHVRSVELDLHEDIRHPGEFRVFHFYRMGNTQCETLFDCLQLLNRFHRVVPDHEPVVILLEAKGVLGLTGLWGTYVAPEHLDRQLWEQFGSAMYTPAEFLSRCDRLPPPHGKPEWTLRDCAAKVGWPTTDQLRGRFIAAIFGSNNSDWSFWNERSWGEYANNAPIRNRAVFPLRLVITDKTEAQWEECPDHHDRDPQPIEVCRARRKAAHPKCIFWNVEGFGWPASGEVETFLQKGGIVRPKFSPLATRCPPVPCDDMTYGCHPQNEFVTGRVLFDCQDEVKDPSGRVLRLPMTMLQTDFPVNFINDVQSDPRLNPLNLPSRVNRPFFERADIDARVTRTIGVEELTEPGARIYFDTANRPTNFDVEPGESFTYSNDAEKVGVARAYMKRPPGESGVDEEWRVFPNTSLPFNRLGPQSNPPVGNGCFFARAADKITEFRLCRKPVSSLRSTLEILAIRTRKGSDGPPVTVITPFRIKAYPDLRSVSNMDGPGEVFLIQLDREPAHTRITVYGAHLVTPNGQFWWRPMVFVQGSVGPVFEFDADLVEQGLVQEGMGVFTNTQLRTRDSSKVVTLADLPEREGKYIHEQSWCLDGNCRSRGLPSHADSFRSTAGAEYWAVHQARGPWTNSTQRTVYTTDRYEFQTGGLHYTAGNVYWSFPKRFLIKVHPTATNWVPLYRCVDWGADRHRYWLSDSEFCRHADGTEDRARNGGILGYVSNVQLPNMQPLYPMNKGNEDQVVLGDGQRDEWIMRLGFRNALGGRPLGYVYVHENQLP